MKIDFFFSPSFYIGTTRDHSLYVWSLNFKEGFVSIEERPRLTKKMEAVTPS